MWNILRIFTYNKQTNKTAIMAKKIKSRVEYQVQELVNNLTEANTTQSEQKRDFFTSKALYNAKRLTTLVSNAKIGALTILMGVMIASCGVGTSTEQAADSTKVDSAVVSTDSTTAAVADTTATK